MAVAALTANGTNDEPQKKAATATAMQLLGTDTDDLVLAYTGTTPAANRTKAGEGGEAFYVYKRKSADGFAIVSATDGKRILAYSHDGRFDKDSIPTACRELLQAYAAANGTTARTTTTVEAIAPMLKTKWGQGYPFNIYCPADERSGQGGKTCLTGCTSTAIAQVMYYHRHPQRPEGSVFYYDGKQSKWREMDFDKQPAFNWDMMAEEYGSTPMAEQCMAVGKLLECVTMASKVDFGADVSLADTKASVKRMADHFGYSDESVHYDRADYDDDAWNKLMMDELRQGRPVIYSGRNTTMGHAFVCDGCDQSGLIHINWGWKGLSDGYYSLSDLNPDEQGDGGSAGGYNRLNSMECGIRPKDGTGIGGSVKVGATFTRQADGAWTITADDTLEKVEMYDSDGRLLHVAKPEGNSACIPAATHGVAIVRITTSGNCTTRKIK